MSKEKNKEDRIIFWVGNVKFDLTIEDAKKLKNKLDNLLGGGTTYYPIYIERPAPVWPQPPYVPTVTWCGTSDGTGNTTLT